MKRPLLTILVLVSLGCSKFKEPVVNLNGNTIWKFGHGGMGVASDYPMNSLEGLKHCFTENMHGSEMDVQLTKDSVLIVFHDEILDGSTTLKGKVNDLTYAEIAEGRFTKNPHLSYKIARLDDVLSAADSDTRFSFDIKLHTSGDYTKYIECFARRLTETITLYDVEMRCFIEAPDLYFMQRISAENSSIERYLYPGTGFGEGLELVLANNLDGLSISNEDVTKDQVAYAHSVGVKVAVWNTHTKKQNKEAAAKFPDVIETDKVSFLARYLP